MKLPRRKFMHLAAGAAALPVFLRTTSALGYPTRPVRLIVGFPASSTSDIIARLMGQWLSERLGQPFVIDDRPGASGNIATEAVVRAPPDGYTLLLVGSYLAINATLFTDLHFDFIRDIAPIASIMRTPSVMEVNPGVPANTVPEFIAYTKANPGKINFASAGNGTVPRVAAELFRMMTSVDIVHVPYRGSPPALADLLAGRVQVMFDNFPTSIEFIKSGRLRPLAVTTTMRFEALPGVPPLGDFVPGYEASLWLGIIAPKGVPAEIIDKLNHEINEALIDAKIKERLTELGGTALGGSPGDFGKLIASETEKWAKVVKFANIKPE